MDRVETRILPVVAAKLGESPSRRKGKVSPAMSISWGLAGPKPVLRTKRAKGKQVNIPAPPTIKLVLDA